jgi:FkbM family methyltransferase
MKDFPSNCVWWNERKDVENFYQIADLFLFTSRGTIHDKETSPLVIREAISFNVASLIYNLPVYLGMYDKYENINYLNFESMQDNCSKILNSLKIKPNNIMPEFIEKQEDIKIGYDRSENKIEYVSKHDIKNAIVSVKDIDSKTVLYAAQHEILNANLTYWIIPVHKSYRDFETDIRFGGMTVEVYSGENLLHSKDFRIRTVNVEKPVLKTKNNITPTYNNYMEFFVDGEYNEYLKGKEFNTVVDVGANAGIWVEYIKYVAKCKKIYAIEPNTQALKTLRDTYTSDELIIIDKALCDKDGELEFFIDPSNSTIGSIKKNHQNSLVVSHKIQGISFRTFIKENNIDHIDLMKMDIEGGEYPFFDSMQKEDLDKIGTILVEYHLQGGQTIDKEVAILLALLRGSGFKYTIKHLHAGGGFIVATK